MSDFSNGLTDAEIEMLALLSEELGEVQQAIGKILRHGYESCHPDFPETTNRMDLEEELGHVAMAIKLMVERGDIDNDNITNESYKKMHFVQKYLHYNNIYLS